MPEPLLRIFSDIHYADSSSRVRSLAMLRPLCEGADELLLNGDTLDTECEGGTHHLEEVKTFFGGLGVPVRFLFGNHDPRLSHDGELSLADGRIWVTHGNVLFENVAPWGWARLDIEARLAPLLANLSAAERGRIQTRLRLQHQVCTGLPEHHHPNTRTLAGKLHRLHDALFPPDRLRAMLRVWRTTPAIADALAAAQRPRAEVVVLGHTHFPGVWRRPGGRVIINTGSFCPPWPARCVDVQGERVRVYRITLRRGALSLGRCIADFPLAPVAPRP